jgi:RNA polymerase sigma factor (sigma-70 family)
VSAETQKKRIADLVAAEWGRLVGTVRAWIDDTVERDAEDVVQDVVEHIYERTDLAEPIADLSAYLYRSLRNRVVDLYRRKRFVAESLVAEVVDTRWEAGAAAERHEERSRLFEAIDALPEPQREVLVATELEGRSFSDLAEEWDTPIGTLLARKHRAIRRLRKTLTGGTE